MTVLTPKVPAGMVDLMKSLSKSVLQEKPENIYEYAAAYFENLLKKRDGSLDKGYGKFRSYQKYCAIVEKMQVRQLKMDKQNDETDSGVGSSNTDDETTKAACDEVVAAVESKATTAPKMAVNGVAIQASKRNTKPPLQPKRTKNYSVNPKLKAQGSIERDRKSRAEAKDAGDSATLLKKTKAKPRKLSSKKPSESLIVITEETSADVADADEVLKMTGAATKIQRAFRRYKREQGAKDTVAGAKAIRMNENLAAYIIQRLFKTMISTKNSSNVNLQRDNAIATDKAGVDGTKGLGEVTSDTIIDSICNINETVGGSDLHSETMNAVSNGVDIKEDQIEVISDAPAIVSHDYDESISHDELQDNSHCSKASDKTVESADITGDFLGNEFKTNKPTDGAVATSEGKFEVLVEHTNNSDSAEKNIEHELDSVPEHQKSLKQNTENIQNIEATDTSSLHHAENKNDEKFEEPPRQEPVATELIANTLDKFENNVDSSGNDLDKEQLDHRTQIASPTDPQTEYEIAETVVMDTSFNMNATINDELLNMQPDGNSANHESVDQMSNSEPTAHIKVASFEEVGLKLISADIIENPIAKETLFANDTAFQDEVNDSNVTGKTNEMIDEIGGEFTERTSYTIADNIESDTLKPIASDTNESISSIRTDDVSRISTPSDAVEIPKVHHEIIAVEIMEDNQKSTEPLLDTMRVDNIECEKQSSETNFLQHDHPVDTATADDETIQGVVEIKEQIIEHAIERDASENIRFEQTDGTDELKINVAVQPIDSSTERNTTNTDKIDADDPNSLHNNAMPQEHCKDVAFSDNGNVIEQKLNALESSDVVAEVPEISEEAISTVEQTDQSNSVIRTKRELKSKDNDADKSANGFEGETVEELNKSIEIRDIKTESATNRDTNIDEKSTLEVMDKFLPSAPESSDPEFPILQEANEIDESLQLLQHANQSSAIPLEPTSSIETLLSTGNTIERNVNDQLQDLKNGSNNTKIEEIDWPIKSTESVTILSPSDKVASVLDLKQQQVVDAAKNEMSVLEQTNTTGNSRDTSEAVMTKVLDLHEDHQMVPADVETYVSSPEQKNTNKSDEICSVEVTSNSNGNLKNTEEHMATTLETQHLSGTQVPEDNQSEAEPTSSTGMTLEKQPSSEIQVSEDTRSEIQVSEDTKSETEPFDSTKDTNIDENKEIIIEKMQVTSVAPLTHADNPITVEEHQLSTMNPAQQTDALNQEAETKTDSDRFKNDSFDQTVNDKISEHNGSHEYLEQFSTPTVDKLANKNKSSSIDHNSKEIENLEQFSIPTVDKLANETESSSIDHNSKKTANEIDDMNCIDMLDKLEVCNEPLIHDTQWNEVGNLDGEQIVPTASTEFGEYVIQSDADVSSNPNEILISTNDASVKRIVEEDGEEDSDQSSDTENPTESGNTTVRDWLDDKSSGQQPTETVPPTTIPYEQLSSDLSETEEKKPEHFKESGVDETSRDELDDLSEVENFDLSSCGEDSLEAMYYSLRKNEIMVDKMHRRASEQREVADNDPSATVAPDDPKIPFPQKITQHLGSAMHEVLGSGSYDQTNTSTGSDSDDVVVGNMQHAFAESTTNLSSTESDDMMLSRMKLTSSANVVSTLANDDDEFMDPMKFAMQQKEELLHRMHGTWFQETINQSTELADQNIEDMDEFRNSPDYGNSGVASKQRKMWNASVSEADSDYMESTGNRRLTKDDFNISTAFDHLTSTDSDSTIVSAATKIQAGARGFLTRRRMRRSSMGTTVSTDNTRCSFGNAAIDKSLEDLIEQQEIISQDDAAIKIQHSYRRYRNKKRRLLNDKNVAMSDDDHEFGMEEYSVDNGGGSEDDIQHGIIEIKCEKKKAECDDGDARGEPLSLQSPDRLPYEPDERYENIIISNEYLEQLPQQLNVDDAGPVKIDANDAHLKHTYHQLSTTTGNVDVLDTAQRRLTLHRGDAVQRHSTPEEIEALAQQQNRTKTPVPDAIVEPAADTIAEINLETGERKSAGPVRSTSLNTAKRTFSLRSLGQRQKSMPVQIDTEIMRVIPKHLRKRIKSAESVKRKST